MNVKMILSTALGIGFFVFSHAASAGTWFDGECSQAEKDADAPCIQVKIGNNYYHYNGGEYDEHDSNPHVGHDDWHGLPPDNAEDFRFSGRTILGCSGLNLDCTLTLFGKVKKCQDSTGAWRIGVKVTDYDVSGALLCGAVSLGGFPWYAKDPSITPHCPFEDDCDNFIPYVKGATNYIGNIGNVNITVLGIPRVTGGHVHGVRFTPGSPATFDFDSNFYSCSESNLGCVVEGTLTNTNADSLQVF